MKDNKDDNSANEREIKYLRAENMCLKHTMMML